MQTSRHRFLFSRDSSSGQGFALVATVSVMVLMVLLTLAMVSLSNLELKNTQNHRHEGVARANARIALMQAIGELQKHAGPDQRVTARAAILESAITTENRNWLGVWRTTVEANGRAWPVIGKATTSGSPYAHSGAYEDLRHAQENLSGSNWKSELRETWLVSQRDSELSHTQSLNEGGDAVVEIVGRGTLGDGLSEVDFQREKVLVQTVKIGEVGAYAWYVADNSQKASIDPVGEIVGHGLDLDLALEISPRGNPALLQLADGSDAYSGFTDEALEHVGEIISYDMAALSQPNPKKMRKALKEKYHALTMYSGGLFVDTMLGGLRKDLTPLLLGDKDEKMIHFSDTDSVVGQNFSSGYPIIPGQDHGVLGPSFGALRNWALQAYNLSEGAEATAVSTAVRMRPTKYWPHAISDGATTNASEWAESAPKIHPVITDVRWHYYFSHHNRRIRTHIIPRVCLWNPYNKDLNVEAMTVMMPNPFYNLSSGMHFFPEERHVNDLQAMYASMANNHFHKWETKGGYVGGDVFKLRLNPFPKSRYLAFTLQATRMAAGECHVFSPKASDDSLEAGGVKIQAYQTELVADNILSSSSPQGGDHFYYDHEDSVVYQISTTGWSNLDAVEVDKIDLSRIFDYQPEISMSSVGKVENFPFILKSGTTASLSDLYTSKNHLTLQLINNSAGGVHSTSSFSVFGDLWGSANQQDGSFGNLQRFSEAPLKDAPDTHQFGVKMLWLDESFTEGNNAPLRHGTSSVTRWDSDHMAYNPCSIANWNIRAQLQTRAPASQCAKRYYLNSLGAFLLQFAPLSPQDFNDQGSLNTTGTAFIKNPFGAAVDFSFNPRVVLFDLPSSDYGILSMAKLRHAMLSSYSWTPTYIVGHSLRDLHAPADSTAHEVAFSPYTKSFPATRWDFLLGGHRSEYLDHGPETENVNSEGLLQIGAEGVQREVGDLSFSSADEVMAYDIAYEVNHNLWDRYFISGMPMSGDTEVFDWDPSSNKRLWNRRYQFNFNGGKVLAEAVANLSTVRARDIAFWTNAEILKNSASFNVNSTSVDAWITFLSGTLGVKRPVEGGELDGSKVSFSRHSRAFKAIETVGSNPDAPSGWADVRVLSNSEIKALAENIVAEVKVRGPFVSIADFVNRRLADKADETSRMGALEAAISVTALNAEFYKNPEYQSTAVNRGSDPLSEDNNLDGFKNSYWDASGSSSQPRSQAWGAPCYLTQSDILESMAPALCVRGDTFTIRAYGASVEAGVVRARAWIEATVERSPNYIDNSVFGNIATDAAMIVNYETGAYQDGGLTEINKIYGRRFIIKSTRWLSAAEI